MEAKQALAFVARRAGASAMEESRWRHVMSLELGWMPPGQAGRYVAACRAAGLLVEEDGLLQLGFDAKGVEVPRGFRPDPQVLPEPTASGAKGPARPSGAATAATASTGQQREAVDASSPGLAAGKGAPAAQTAAQEPAQDSGGGDLFSTWLPKVAAARREDIAATMAAVERQQEAAGGLLHAEPALLRLGAEAGLDVRAAAQEALNRLRA